MQRVVPWFLVFSLALAQNLRLELAPGSEARYRVREQLVGVNFPNDAVGTTRTLSGGVVLEPGGKVVSGRFVVGLAALQSDEARRDNFIRRNTLQTDRFPEAVFVPKEVRGLSLPLRPGSRARVEIVGDLTIRDVARSQTWTGEYEVTSAGCVSGQHPLPLRRLSLDPAQGGGGAEKTRFASRPVSFSRTPASAMRENLQTPWRTTAAVDSIPASVSSSQDGDELTRPMKLLVRTYLVESGTGESPGCSSASSGI